ncbi:hypothetical protein AVEN_185669-1 [Araneus ventricosus]|uniref:Tc1-like transposase DDE domain-containing protein n=1 Tax=Araneus ventricosus TaxID=182803 RepID=A0A4Y2FTM2_ARAVE|nr:hypothetical protein AVEN_185669-1 [Araneus ventricosus]
MGASDEVDDFLIGYLHTYLLAYLLPKRLSGQCYLIFLERVLPELLQDVPIAIRNQMWLQHDGATAHFSIDVRNYLNASFGARWIGRVGPVPITFYGESFYATPVDSDEDLVARISASAARVHGIFKSVRQSLHRRCQAHITDGGRKFEQLL